MLKHANTRLKQVLVNMEVSCLCQIKSVDVIRTIVDKGLKWAPKMNIIIFTVLIYVKICTKR